MSQITYAIQKKNGVFRLKQTFYSWKNPQEYDILAKLVAGKQLPCYVPEYGITITEHIVYEPEKLIRGE